MSYMEQGMAFARTGIQELSLDEIEEVQGALSNFERGLIYVGIGAAAIAAAPVLGGAAAATFGITLGGRVLMAGGGLLLFSSSH